MNDKELQDYNLICQECDNLRIDCECYLDDEEQEFYDEETFRNENTCPFHLTFNPDGFCEACLYEEELKQSSSNKENNKTEKS